MDAQKNYERIMETIKPFIQRHEKPKPRPREVWRRGEDLPEEFNDGRYRIEHHMAPRSQS